MFQKPWVIQTCLHDLSTFLRAKYGLRCLLPKWSRCPGSSDYTGEHHQEVDHNTFHRLLVFIVSAALFNWAQCLQNWGSSSWLIRKIITSWWKGNLEPFQREWNISIFYSKSETVGKLGYFRVFAPAQVVTTNKICLKGLDRKSVV